MTGKNESRPIVVWLRNDLRLDDNPALAHAAETGAPVIVVYVLEDETKGVRSLGGAHRWWLHHSLDAFSKDLEKIGVALVLRRGGGEGEIAAIVEEAGAGAIYFNRRYEPGDHDLEDRLRKALPDIEVESFTANLLHEPDSLRTKTGGFYKVYTPFRKALMSGSEPRDPIDAPTKLNGATKRVNSEALKTLDLLPTKPDWSAGIAADWTPGEAAALKRFKRFCRDSLKGYEAGRNKPPEDATSRMSPHLRFGEVSPYRLWHLATQAQRSGKGVETFRSELIWRDFNYHLLFNKADLPDKNFNERFDKLSWRRAKAELTSWQKGLTGYPIVDAGMRQLWTTGWLHNRVRMIVGSFLTRDLLIDWKAGEAWFWDTLVDGDPASNTSQWQWIAGTGADAQPFFRIFNPITQSEKFDPDGVYIRRYVPELEKLPTEWIHAPWTAPAAVLEKAGITLGKTYPEPMVDHGEARDRALAAYAETRN